MEEDDYSRSGAEFTHELREDDRYHVSHFIKEHTHSIDLTYRPVPKSSGEFYDSCRGRSGDEEVGGLEAIGGFGAPLVFFAETPEDEDEGENGGEEDGEPGSRRDFG